MNTAQKTIRDHTFIEFKVRDHGWSRENAKFELENFLTVNGVPVLESFYTFVRRTGAPVILSRAKRISVHQTFRNAINHATF